MQSLGDYVFLLEGSETVESKVSGYVESDTYGKNTHNIGYYIVSLLPLVVYPLFSLWYCKRCSINEKIKNLEPFVMLGVMFVMIQASFIIAYRYIDFFKIYYEICFAETFVCLIKNDNRLKLSLSFVKNLLIFTPILFLTFQYFFIIQYSPYSSIIEKSVIEEREKRYMELGIDLYYNPKTNEY